MLGLALAVPEARDRGVVGLKAGLDIILGESNEALPLVWQGIVDAVRFGQLPEARIDESVRRVLRAKSSAWLPEDRMVDPDAWKQVLDHPRHRQIVNELAIKSCSEIIAPSDGLSSHLLPDSRVLVLRLQASQRIFYRYNLEVFSERLTALIPTAEFRAVGRPVTAGEEQQILASLADFDEVLVVSSDWTRIASDTQQQLLQRLIEAEAPLNLVLFGAPYAAQGLDGIRRGWCAYSTVPECQITMAEVIAGVRAPLGRLPVRLT
jgi:beta-N-acetylhexosaminidase